MPFKRCVLQDQQELVYEGANIFLKLRGQISSSSSVGSDLIVIIVESFIKVLARVSCFLFDIPFLSGSLVTNNIHEIKVKPPPPPQKKKKRFHPNLDIHLQS